MDIPYYDKARAACGTCAQQSSYTESEITSLVPQSLSSFPSFAVRTASNGKLGRSLGTSTQCEPESFLPMAMITAMKRSPSTFFAAGACLPYVATKCTNAQSAFTTSQRVCLASIEILFAMNCRTYEIWGLKVASEAIF